MMLFVLAHAIGHLDVFLIFFFFGCVGSLLLRAGFSLVAASGGGVATHRCVARVSHCGGLSCCGARALGAWASAVVARGL